MTAGAREPFRDPLDRRHTGRGTCLNSNQDVRGEAVPSLAWTNGPLFTVGLVQRGHSDETIRQVLGENMLRVWRDNVTSS